MQEKHENYMHIALQEAVNAFEKNEIPIGCIIVLNEEIIGRGHNFIENNIDPTAHAEIIALRKACTKTRSRLLTGATAYVTVEPCPMCAAALIEAHISKIVFGTKNHKLGAILSVWNFPNDPAFEHHPLIIGGVLENECKEILDAFFRRLR